MTVPIRVTVDGEPVTREVTMEQMRAYLLAKGWERRAETADHHEHFTIDDKTAVIDPLQLEQAIGDIAGQESRSPAAVLREIAGEAEEYVRIWDVALSECVARVWLGHDGTWAVRRIDGALIADFQKTHALAGALRQAVIADPREKTTVERRADEIEATRPANVQAALLFAKNRHADAIDGRGNRRDGYLLEAAAWILVAQRALAREAAR